MLYKLTLKCYKLTLKCYKLTLKCYKLTLKCCKLTLKCYKLTLKCYKLTLKCYKLTLCYIVMALQKPAIVMALQKPAISKAIPEPAATDTTSLPKKQLSYRWVIHDAKAFIDLDDEGVTSPTFTVTLPLKENCGHAISSWYLQVTRSRGYYSNNNIQVFLCSHNEPYISSINTTVLVSHCTLSIINNTTEEILSSKNAPSVQCTIDESKDIACGVFEVNLQDGRLTVQVDATLHYFTQSKREPAVNSVSRSNLQTGLKTLFDRKLFVDVTIKSRDKEFKAHKAVLASQSPVFKAMLSKKKGSSVVDISEADPKVVSEMLSYLYTGRAPNLDTMTRELLLLASKYEISYLLEMTQKKLKSDINASNVVELLIFATTHDTPSLKKACLTYISLHSAEVMRTSDWNKLENSLKIEVADFVQ